MTLSDDSDDATTAAVFAALMSIPDLSASQLDSINTIRRELKLTHDRLGLPHTATIPETEIAYAAEVSRALKQARAIAANR